MPTIDPFLGPDGHQVRERSVPCRECGRPTWNVAAVCDAHEAPK